VKKRVLVVDDNEAILTLIVETLKSQYEVATAENALEATDQLEQFSPDLVLLDIILPDMSGYEVCSQMKAHEKYSSIPVVLISSKTGSASRTTGYQLGAVNYLEKPFSPEELRAIVERILKDSEKAVPESLKIGDLSINLATQEVKRGDKLYNLTGSEFKILTHLSKNPSQVVSRDKLLNIVAPNQLEINDRLVDTHVSAIRRKIKESSVSIKAVYAEGYKLLIK